ncbi:MAG: restriction endonuclease [Rhodobacteraceae bacterium]|nr:restriction endonuclease [Paracoccaceae bacterium]
MTCFQISEHGRLPIGDPPQCSNDDPPRQIPAQLAARFVAAVQGAGFRGAPVLEIRGRNLRAGGVVGVVVAGDHSLEILPKIDTPGLTDHAAVQTAIRTRLVHMLEVARKLKIAPGPQADLGLQRHTVLEILIRVFCDRLSVAVRRGMPRAYVAREDDLPSVRGRLDMVRQFTRHAANPSRLACRFDDLSSDIALNRIMKAAIEHLIRMARSPANQQRLRELAFVYADIASIPIPALPWGNVVLDRTSHAWREIIVMAEMFLRQQHQTTSQGDVHGTALLFDMSALFEEYVGQLVRQALAGTGLRVSLQGGHRYCLKARERELFQTRPDILIQDGARTIHVIDTKWKHINQPGDHPKHGVSQADVYQMMAYAHLYNAPRLTLLYPHHVGLAKKDGRQASFCIACSGATLEVATIEVPDRPGMNECVQRLQSQIRLPQGGADLVNALSEQMNAK